jgi:carbamoyl-phosphate synthase large subunit
VYATEGTAEVLRRNGVKAVVLGKHSAPTEDLVDCVEMIMSGQIDLVFNTPWGVGPRLDGYEIRTACVVVGVPCITTIQGAAACVQGIESLVRGETGVRSLQSYHAQLRSAWSAGPAPRTGPTGRAPTVAPTVSPVVSPAASPAVDTSRARPADSGWSQDDTGGRGGPDTSARTLG